MHVVSFGLAYACYGTRKAEGRRAVNSYLVPEDWGYQSLPSILQDFAHPRVRCAVEHTADTALPDEEAFPPFHHFDLHRTVFYVRL